MLSGTENRLCTRLPTRRGCRKGPRIFWEDQAGFVCVGYANVRLDKAKVALNGGANILHPFDGTFLVGND